MTTAIIIAVISGGVLAALTHLFRLEQKRERRFLMPVRAVLDLVAEKMASAYSTMAHFCGSGRLWRYGRFVVLLFVEGVLLLLHRLEQFLLRVHRRQNKTLHTTTAFRNDGHLGEVSAHKRDTALSQEEKERLREEMLE